MIDVTIVPLLQDNYAYLLKDAQGQCLILDPGQITPVEAVVKQHGLRPLLILNTHHHADHVAGNADLKALYNIEVYGPLKEAKMIPGLNKGLGEGDTIAFDDTVIDIIETPGHTNGHICFYVARDNLLFAGDTLFSLGCGRLFEGTAEDMYRSLQKLKALPDETLLYCGHEYTEANGRFALAVDPDNATLKTHMDDIRKKRANNLPSLPSTLALEKKDNPFLRAGSAEEFAALRLAKDNF